MRLNPSRIPFAVVGLAAWLVPRAAHAQGVEGVAGDLGRVLLTTAAILLSLAAGATSVASGLGRVRTGLAAAFALATMLLFAVWLLHWRDFVLWSTWLGAGITVGAVLVGLVLRNRRIHG